MAIKYLYKFLIILLFYSICTEARCRRFDEKALDHVDFDKLSGHWSIIYSSDSKLDTNCSHIDYKQKEGTSITFNIFYNSSKSSNGTILNNESKRLQIAIDGIQSTFWILNTDYKSFLLTYQCTKVVINGHKQSKDVYRILSRQKLIETPVFQRLDSFLKAISSDIHINPVSQSNCENIEKKCRKFEDKSVKNLDLNKLSGQWNLLFTTDSDSDLKCTTFENNLIDSNSFEFLKNVECTENSNGLVSKCPPKEKTLKLLSTTGNKTSSLWILDTDYSNFILSYQCCKEEVNGIIRIKDVYRILGRKELIPESNLQKSETLLKSISKDIQLSPISQSNCNCNQTSITSSPIPLLATKSPLIRNKCQNFEDKSVKNLDLKDLTGQWNLLFSTDYSDSNCTYLENNLINNDSLEVIKYVKCVKNNNLWISKCSPKENTSKLLSTVSNTTSNLWNIETGCPNYLLIYHCSKQDVNGITQISETYRIYARNKSVPEPLLQKIEDVLNTISNDIILNSLSHSECDCNLTKSLTPLTTSIPLTLNTTIKQPENQKCKNFEDKTVKNINFNELSGRWNALYSTNNWDSNCTSAELDVLNHNSLEYNKYVKCVKNSNALITKCSPRDKTSKLLLTSGNTTSYVWNLETGSPNHLLIYHCSKQKVNGITQISESYQIFSRKNAIPKPILQKIEGVFNTISNDIVLNPLSQSGCECNLNISITPPSIPLLSSLPPTLSPLENKKCQNFEDKSVKNLDLRKLSGRWKLLYTSEKKSDFNCTDLIFNQINSESFEFTKSVNCIESGSGLISKSQTKDSASKLLLTAFNTTYNLWILALHYNDYALTYQCSKHQNKANVQIKEVYQIYGRNDAITQSVLERLEHMLNTISNDIIMSPISHSNCICDQISTTSRTSPSLTPTSIQNTKKCRKFEDKSIKYVDFKKISGDWKLLFTSGENSDLSCTQLQFNPINNESLEFTKFINCSHPMNGLVSKCPPKDKTLKLLLTAYNTTYSLWVLALNYSDYLLTYQCSKHDNEGIVQIKDVYKIYGRKNTISEPILQLLENLLNTISEDIILSPISHSNCKCDDKTLMLSEESNKVAIPECKSFASANNLNANKIGGKWKLLFHNNASIGCSIRQILEIKGEIINPEQFFDTVSEQLVTAGSFEVIETGKYLRRIKGKSDETATILYIDSKVFISYLCYQDFSGSAPKLIENIGVYGRSNRFEEILPANASAKLIELGLNDKILNLDNSNCKVAEGCPIADGLALKSYDWKMLSGKWYRIYSTDETQCINFEIEKGQSRLTSKRYFIKRQSSDLLSTGFFKLQPNGDLTSNTLGENPSVYHVIQTDYHNYLIEYRCLSNKKIEMSVLSRGRDLDPETLDLAYSKLSAAGVELILKPVDQTNCDYETYEGLVCTNCIQRSVLNIDLNRFHGVWYPILINQPGARCIRVEDNRRALSDPSNKDEYWYDVIDETGIQGYGRIKTNQDGRLTELNFKVEGDKRLTILDTDYDNYQVYHQCAIGNINGVKRKIVEYGLMSRKPSVNSSIINKARKLFDDNGLGEAYSVDQQKCQFFNISKRPGINDYHCKNVEKFVVKNVDLDKLTGKWFGLYAHHSGLKDVTSDFAKNPNSSSEYSHVYETRFDDHVFRGSIRLDKSGILFATSTDHISVAEFKYNILDVNYTSHLIMYKCVKFDGSLSKIEKLHVLSRSCSLDQSIIDRAAKIVRNAGFEDNLSEIMQYQCRDDLKYDSHFLSENCRHFHNAEIVDLNFAKISGRWDLQLSTDLTSLFDYNIIKTAPDNQMQMDFFKDSKSMSTQFFAHVKESNMLKRQRNANLANCAVVSTDYQSYSLTYSCQEYQNNHFFRASEYLYLISRSNTSINVDDLHEIITEIPAISLNKVTDLVSKLTGFKTEKHKLLGEKVKDEVLSIVKNYQKENQLSSHSDKEVYHSLSKVCRHFNDEDLVSADLSTISKNWSLDFTTFVNEKIPFDRVKITKKSDNTFNVALLNKNQLIANAINYHPNHTKVLRSFLEGRRGLIVHLLANNHYRVTYFCDEYQINGTLTKKEILRLYSRENSAKPRDWYSYLEAMVANLNAKTWNKIDDLLQKLNPVIRGCFDQSLSTNSIKTILTNYLTPKLHLEQKVHSLQQISNKGDNEVYESLTKVCRHFDEEELIEAKFSELAGSWRLDWSSWPDSATPSSYYIVETKLQSDRLVYIQSNSSFNSKPQKGYANHVMGTKYFHNIHEGRRGRVALLWTDYNHYSVLHYCAENQIDNQITGNEVFFLYSRNVSTKPRDLNTYIEILANNLQPKTLAKISHSVNRLLPFDMSLVNDEIKPYIKKLSNRAMPKEVIEEKLTLAEDLYYKFVTKGVVTKPINTILADREVSVRSDEKVYGSLIKVCRTLEENELEEIDYTKSSGRWNIDWSSSCKTTFPFDSMDNQVEGPNSLQVRYFLNSEVIAIANMVHVKGSKFNQRIVDGRRERVATLYSDSNNAIIYSCSENQINGTITGKEVLRFFSRSNITGGTELNVYIKKLVQNLKPITLAKISDLTANLRPVDSGILNKECHLLKQLDIKDLNKGLVFDNNDNDVARLNMKVSDERNQLKGISKKNDSEVYSILEQNCRAFDQKDLVEPIFNRVKGVWRVDYASWLNSITPYDVLEFRDRGDRLHISRSLSSKVVSHGSAHHIKGSRYLRQNIDGRRGIEAYLWTEYIDHLIVYLCQENYVNGVLRANEVLRLLSRVNTTKGRDLEAYENLIMSDVKNKVSDIITDLVANLRPLYNESDDQTIPVNNSKIEVPLNSSKYEESCPDYDGISQKDIDFSKLTGRWDAIYTSNRRWDHDCIYAIDSYNKTSNSINSEKHTNNKTHHVLMLHSNNTGRQIVIVDNTEFQSWILSTDFKTYKLAYTCYVREINGKKRKIDLQRLYTKGIEATNFDKNLLEKLRQKSSEIGKTLEPIERTKCIENDSDWEKDY